MNEALLRNLTIQEKVKYGIITPEIMADAIWWVENELGYTDPDNLYPEYSEDDICLLEDTIQDLMQQLEIAKRTIKYLEDAMG